MSETVASQPVRILAKRIVQRLHDRHNWETIYGEVIRPSMIVNDVMEGYNRTNVYRAIRYLEQRRFFMLVTGKPKSQRWLRFIYRSFDSPPL